MKGFHLTKPGVQTLTGSPEELGTVNSEAPVHINDAGSPLDSDSEDSGFHDTTSSSDSGKEPRTPGSLGTDIPDIAAVDGEPTKTGIADEPPKLLVWSAGDREGINRVVTSYQTFFLATPEICNSKDCLGNLAYTLAGRRSSLFWKSFSVVTSSSDLRLLSEEVIAPSKSLKDPTLGFVFTGQGSQWPQMGQELLRYPVFRKSMEGAQAFFKSLGCEWSLLGAYQHLVVSISHLLTIADELALDSTKTSIHKPSLSQPVCTAIQVALVNLLHSFSIFPSVVVGHSSGEIAAA